MKNKRNLLITLLLCLMMSVSIFGCAGDNTSKEENTQTTKQSDSADSKSDHTDSAKSDLWANASYTEDTELGEGKTTVKVEVAIEGKSVTFTLHTDETILGNALLAHSLIAGEDGDYGLYIKDVNGVTADYDTDKAYWAFYKDGEYMNTGVDGTTITDGEHYELVYTKE